MISIRFEMPALVDGSWRISRSESVTAVLNFFRMVVRLVDDADDALRVAGRRRHEPLGILEVLHPCALVGVHALRHRERLAVARVEALGDVPRQLEVLTLVVSDRDDVGLVEKDVAGHRGPGT